jgi:hypothetical protein
MSYLSEAAAVFKKVGVWNHTKKGGDRIEVEITSHPINWNGRRARVAFARDVTEEKSPRRAYVLLPPRPLAVGESSFDRREHPG